MSEHQSLSAWRQGLYCAVLASLAVPLGWLVWLTAVSVARDWRVLLSPIVGAVLGLVVERLIAHFRVARLEVAGILPDPKLTPSQEQAVQARPAYGATLRASLGGAGAFLAGACENVAGDAIADTLRPFFASLVIIAPAGFLFGIAFRERESWQHTQGDSMSILSSAVIRGLAFGAVCGMVTALTALLAGQARLDASSYPYLAWWTLFGLAAGLAHGFHGFRGEPRPWALAWAAPLALLLAIVGSGMVGSQRVSGSLFGPVLWVGGQLGRVAFAQPGLPAHAWTEAENKPGQGSNVIVVYPESPGGITISTWAGCPDPIPPANPQASAQPGEPLRLLQQRLSQLTAELAARRLGSEWRTVCRDLRQGPRSGMARSAAVLMLFSIALGLAYSFERSLRPPVYSGSRTQRLDLELGIGLLVVLAASFFLLRFWLE
jgi:hypothetical protein